MYIAELNLFDKNRSREIPILVYTPNNLKENYKVVIFGPGYQEQEILAKKETILGYKKWEYLAEYFVNKGYAFISIQHDMLGDADGLETINPKENQSQARKHLWVRGEQNILYVMKEIKLKYPHLNLDNFIIAGHSNGGDIAKFFANNYPSYISHVISFDGRRCSIKAKNVKFLIFEANDTSTDLSVFPDEEEEGRKKRTNMEWIIVKPKDATHISYRGDQITDKLKNYVLNFITFFLQQKE